MHKRGIAYINRIRRLFVKLRLHISRHKRDSLTVRKIASAHQQTHWWFLGCSHGSAWRTTDESLFHRKFRFNRSNNR